MKVARFHQTGVPEVIQIEDLARPTPGPGQVLVKVEAAGLNFADTIRRAGKFYPMPTPLPHITGSEACGVVEAVGEGVDADWVGARVIVGADGAFAEYIAVPTEAIFRAPEGIDPTQAVALFVQGLTAALLIKVAARMQPGESVFVEGAAGGVGSLLVQLAKLYGAGTVVAGASSEDKQQLALSLGADAAVNYRAPGWAQQVLDVTGGRGVDYQFNMSGQKAFDEGLKSLAFRGRMVVFGGAEGGPPTVNVGQLFGKAQGVQAFVLGFFLRDRPLIERTLEELAGYVRDGKLRLTIGGTYRLDQAAEAHRVLESGGSMGKLVIVP